MLELRSLSSNSLDEHQMSLTSARRRGDAEEENLVLVRLERTEHGPTLLPAIAARAFAVAANVSPHVALLRSQAALMATEVEFEHRSSASSSRMSMSSGASSASSDADVESEWVQMGDKKRPKPNVDALPIIGETPSFADLFQ